MIWLSIYWTEYLFPQSPIYFQIKLVNRNMIFLYYLVMLK
jgi:hypothetical protein